MSVKPILIGSLVLLVGRVAVANDTDLSRATWQMPAHEQVRAMLDEWLIETDVEKSVAEKIRQEWYEPIAETQRLSRLAESFADVDPEVKMLVDFCMAAKSSPEVPAFSILQSSDATPFLRNNLRLLYARWLSQNRLYDETLEQIESVQPEDVVDPASLLFYKSLSYHRLLMKDKCLPVVDQLLEREEALPRRYSTLAKLVRADIEPLEEDSLDEISRLMDSIKVRLGHARAGKRVRTEEESVIEKLDKMIKELEDKAKSAAAAAAGAAGNSNQPSKPMDDSMPGGVKGDGNVDAKEIGDKSGWGDLPPKERQQALQQLGKDFPSHYREVIEEYFRKLGRDGGEQP